MQKLTNHKTQQPMVNHTIQNGTTLMAGKVRVRFICEPDECPDNPLPNWDGSLVKCLYYGTGNIDGAERVPEDETTAAIFDMLPKEHRHVQPGHGFARLATVETAPDEDGDFINLQGFCEHERFFGYAYGADDVEQVWGDLKYKFWDYVHPKVQNTWGNFGAFAKLVLGYSSAEDFIQARVDACHAADVIDLHSLTVGHSPWVTLTIVTFPGAGTSESYAEELKQYLDGEVYYCGAVVEVKCDCCNNWHEHRRDGVGGVYSPADELISYPWADYIVPEIENALPANFWSVAE